MLLGHLSHLTHKNSWLIFRNSLKLVPLPKNLSRKLLNALNTRMAGAEGKSRDFILQAIDFPIQGQALSSY